MGGVEIRALHKISGCNLFKAATHRAERLSVGNSHASAAGTCTVSTGSRIRWLPCSTTRKLQPALDLPRLMRPP